MFTSDRHNTNKKVTEATAGKNKPMTVHAYFFVYKLVIYELNQATKALFHPERIDVLSWLFLLYQNVKEDQEQLSILRQSTSE